MYYEVTSLINRQEKILKQREGANNQFIPSDYAKIRVGAKSLDDATLNLGSFKAISPKFGEKKEVLKAIACYDIDKMRQISNFFYKTSGIYSRLCRYMAYSYKYDWFITPYINNCEGLLDTDSGLGDTDSDSEEEIKNKKKQFANFFKVLKYFQNSQIKKFFGEVALKVVKNGCYYGYLIPHSDKMIVQQLPPRYCRSKYKKDNRPVVEFNMRYFDDNFITDFQRARALEIFPKEFKKGYKLYKQGKLDFGMQAEDRGWYLLDPNSTIKFNINDEDFPAFISVIPPILDLDAAQDLDRRKMAQKLLKIIIQKMPIDKNGDLVFDPEEAQELHNNAVRMLSRAIGIDVLTTFADVQVADMSDRGTTTTVDELAKVERTVYNEAGVSQLQFNSTGNIALNNSILNDEASMYNLLLQFEAFLNLILESFNKSPKKCYYQAQLLTTTIYNYKQLAKMYKEQAQMGYNKMLPQVALGQTQSSILANAYFENDILDLVRVFVPPLTSNTMNAQALQQRSAVTKGKPQQDQGEGAGRPEKEDSEKAEKTIRNLQSM